MKKNKLTVLVMARDPNIDCSILTSKFWEIFWTKSLFERVLCTETVVPVDCIYDRVILTNNKNMTWTERLDFALDRIDSEYIFLLVEDFFLKDSFSDDVLINIISFMEKENAGCVHLDYLPRFSKKYSNEYNVIPKDSIYRIVAQNEILKKEYLKRFSTMNTTIWQFERKASIRSREYPEKIFCTKKQIYPCIHAKSERMWYKDAIDLFKKNNIDKKYYEKQKIYPKYKLLIGKIKWILICMFPNLINNIQIKRSDKKEKKIKTC